MGNSYMTKANVQGSCRDHAGGQTEIRPARSLYPMSIEALDRRQRRA
jgi:hypothetical protein